MPTHPFAVHQIHDERTAGGQGALDSFQYGEVVLRPLEITERVPQQTDAMKLGLAETKAPGIAFVERNRQVALPGALAGEANEIAGAVEPSDMRKAAPGE